SCSQREEGGWVRRLPIGSGTGGAAVVLRVRESRSHREGRQRGWIGGAAMTQEALVNSDAPSVMDIITGRVARTQIKYHRWAKADRHERFGDLFNLVSHPDFLLVAWEHVARNKGARTAGVDGVTVRQISQRGEV